MDFRPVNGTSNEKELSRAQQNQEGAKNRVRDAVPLGESRRSAPWSSVSNLRVAARLERLERMEAMRIVDVQARTEDDARGTSRIAENAARGTASITRGVSRCEVERTPAKMKLAVSLYGLWRRETSSATVILERKRFSRLHTFTL